MPRMTAEELEQFLYSHFPDAEHRAFTVERVDEMFALVRMRYDHRHLRPGGTISGPSLMMLSDTAMYMALLRALRNNSEPKIDWLRRCFRHALRLSLPEPATPRGSRVN